MLDVPKTRCPILFIVLPFALGVAVVGTLLFLWRRGERAELPGLVKSEGQVSEAFRCPPYGSILTFNHWHNESGALEDVVEIRYADIRHSSEASRRLDRDVIGQGMTEEQVVAALGPPNHWMQETKADKTKVLLTYLMEEPGYFYFVSLVDGRVVQKRFDSGF